MNLELALEEGNVKDVSMEPEGTSEEYAADREEVKSIMIRRQVEALNELNAQFEEQDRGDPREEKILQEYNRWLKEGSRDGGAAFVLDESLSGGESLTVLGLIGRDGGYRAASQGRTPEGLIDYGKVAAVMEEWTLALQTGTQ